MRATVVITKDGKVSVITREGSFIEGKERVERLLADLGAEGLEVEAGEKEFEQHRHDHERVQVRVEQG